jgi:D-glycero-alpha-D-manno-heptose-7-phosphate kinase
MVSLVDVGHRMLEANLGVDLLILIEGLLRETWDLKKRLSPRVSSTEIDALYDLCCRTGALAGKLCGAGSGGFLLMVVPPDRRGELSAAVGDDRCVSFRIEHSGSVVSHRW